MCGQREATQRYRKPASPKKLNSDILDSYPIFLMEGPFAAVIEKKARGAFEHDPIENPNELEDTIKRRAMARQIDEPWR